jgi:hypothetical protein
MALFTDGPAACIEDLSAQDSQLLNIASVEGIDVTQKLRLAHDELGLQIYTLLSTVRCSEQNLWLRPKPDLAVVVVTPALKLWHTYRTLEMFYADAYNSQLNDRYAGRRDQFHGMARWAYEKLLQAGLGIVTAPVAQAASPKVSAAAGDALPQGTYYVTMAWVNRMGESGAPGAPVDIAITGKTVLVAAGKAPANASGWNVFVGVDPGGLVQQNSSPIAVGDTWLQFAPTLDSGPGPGWGQEPNYVQPMPRVIQRG